MTIEIICTVLVMYFAFGLTLRILCGIGDYIIGSALSKNTERAEQE